MKNEWRKAEKELYTTKSTPTIIDIGPLNYITITGHGNPNEEDFGKRIGALYPVAYHIKMNNKDILDFTVYPLEGIWDLSEKGRQEKTLNKSELVYKLMIRQPSFVTKEIVEAAKLKKQGTPYIEEVQFETITEGKCVQMLHKGSYDDEDQSFAKMEAFALENGLHRASKVHKEIYLSRPNPESPEKMKTILRFNVD